MRYFIIIALVLFASCKPDLVKPDFTTGHIDTTDIALTADHDTAFANGLATVKLQLKINITVLGKYKTATFTVNPVGRFSSGGTEMSTAIDADGHATVYINSPQEGIANVKATIGDYTIQKNIVFSKFALTDTLSIAIISDNIPADNYTYAHIQVKANNPDLMKSIKSITFKTDKGKFANGDVSYTTNTGVDGTADAYLKHNIAERAIVTATIAGTYTREATVNFIPAWPDALSVEPAQSTMARIPGTHIDITSKLTRQYGMPSQGLTVHFRDSSSSSPTTHPGTFLATTRSNADGIATTQYHLQDTASVTGYIYIISYIDTGKNNNIIAVNRILLQ